MEFFPFLLIGLFILFGPWILVLRASRDRKLEREEDLDRWRELSQRVVALDGKVKELQNRAVGPVAPPVDAQPPVAPRATKTAANPCTIARRPCHSCETAHSAATTRAAAKEFSHRFADTSRRTTEALSCRLANTASRRATSFSHACSPANVLSHHRIFRLARPPNPVLARSRRNPRHQLAQQTRHRHPRSRRRLLPRLST